MNKKQLTRELKKEASRLGFEFTGISKAGFLEDEAPRLESWLNQNMHGKMQYMQNHFDKRLDPTKLVEGTKSVVSLLYNYYSTDINEDPTAPKVSMYAYGIDYHSVVKEKLRQLMLFLQEKAGAVSGRYFVDSAPVLEKAWAVKSGLGWIGKNGNLINKAKGSYFFIAELMLDIPLEYDQPISNYCGTCTRCVDACPTEAIVQPYVVDGSKCISYFTIELKDQQIPGEMAGKFDNWIFGCDICQQVCPWNRFAKPNSEPGFKPLVPLQKMKWEDWEEMTEEVFNRQFKDSPLRRTKFKGLKRNLEFIKPL
jgi:epoxyqueuosine reductase